MDVFRGAFWGSIWNNSFRFRYSIELLIEAEIFVDRFIWIERIRDVFRGAFWGEYLEQLNTSNSMSLYEFRRGIFSHYQNFLAHFGKLMHDLARGAVQINS